MPELGKISMGLPIDFSNFTRQTDFPTPPEPEWLGQCLERNTELPAEQADMKQQFDGLCLLWPEEDWLGQSLERDTGFPAGQPYELPLIELFAEGMSQFEQAGMEQQFEGLLSERPPHHEEDWLGQPLERDTELPAGPPYERPLSELFAEGMSQIVPSWIEHNFERDTELPAGAPVSNKVLQKFFSKTSTPPDISKGLGRNQEKRDISQLEQFVVDNLPLMMYEEELYLYEPPCWRKLNERRAKKEIRAFLEKECQIGCLTANDYRKIRDLLVINPDISEERKLTSPGGKVNMLDGTYDLQTGELLPHDPKDYFFSCINVHGQEMDTCRGDTFEAFVQNCSGGDPMVRKQLLQLVALTILGKPFKHFFVLLGESNTGKTQFGRFLEELVGHKNVGSVRGAHDFGDRWTVGSLAGKLLGVCLDLPNGPFPAAAIGTIKQMTGDDSVKVEEKYLAPSTCYEKPLLLFAGNHPIQTPRMEEEQALLNRMIVIPFRNPVQEADMKQELYKDLLEEAPYIVREAFAEYRELEWNNFQLARAELPPELMPCDSRAEYRDIGRFIAQRCEYSENTETFTKDLYQDFCTFIGRNTSKSIEKSFAQQLKEHLKKDKNIEYLKRVAGTDYRGYRGIRLKQDRPEDIDPLS